MKYRSVKIAGIVAVLAFFMASHQAIAQDAIFDPIRDVIKTGSAKEMSRYLNQNIEINIEGNVNTYSKAQSEFVFRDFFKKHPPTSFTIVHKGASKGGQQFAIGRYISGNDSYNVLMLVKEVSATYLIHEISFVKE
ncbi:MAG TPA: hypothetical protein DIS90_05580 [Cytophagales bacterium]|nr:hypothetical protein [Cytophagales bacterium]HCR53010.1 hypothetical protein [Cytophagales bacterium]